MYAKYYLFIFLILWMYWYFFWKFSIVLVNLLKYLSTLETLISGVFRLISEASSSMRETALFFFLPVHAEYFTFENLHRKFKPKFAIDFRQKFWNFAQTFTNTDINLNSALKKVFLNWTLINTHLITHRHKFSWYWSSSISSQNL